MASTPRKTQKKKRRTKTKAKSAAKPSLDRQVLTVGAGAAAVAFVLGGAIGWFARDSRDATAPAPSASVAVGGADCAAWQKKICDEVGGKSPPCMDARSAANILPDQSCRAAMGDLPGIIERLKKERMICTNLVDKICKQFGANTPQCNGAKARVDAMPTSGCQKMLDNYDTVINQLQKVRGTPPTPPAAP